MSEPVSSYVNVTPAQARAQRLAAAIPRHDDGLAGIDDFVIPAATAPSALGSTVRRGRHRFR